VTHTSRAEALAPWLTGVLLACPVLWAYYPPASDLPYHEAGISLLRDFHDATKVPAGLYELNLGEPNQLFYLLGWAISHVVSTRWAVKLLLAGTVLALPICAARLSRHAGSSPMASLLVAPIALGWLFSNGFVTNLLGLAVLLATLPLLDRLGDEPTWRRALTSLGALVLLYFAHLAMMVAFAAAALGSVLTHSWSWRKSAWRLSPFVAGVAIAFAQGQWQKRYITASFAGLSVLWEPLSHKALVAPRVLSPQADDTITWCMSVLLVLATGAFLRLRSREQHSMPSAEEDGRTVARLRAWAHTNRWQLFALAGVLAYLAFPLTLGGWQVVYQRWLPPSFAVLAACSGPRDLRSRPAQLVAALVCIVPIATLLVTVPSFVDSDREVRSLEKLLPEIAPGSSVACLTFGSAGQARSYTLTPGRVLAVRGGRISNDFTNTPIFPVVTRKEYGWDGVRERIASGGFRPAHDLRMFRYILALTSDRQTAKVATLALGGDATLVDSSDDWLLFESNLSVVPPASPALKMERPAPETLKQRAETVLARIGGQAAP
jgi:hypothetical protein